MGRQIQQCPLDFLSEVSRPNNTILPTVKEPTLRCGTINLEKGSEKCFFRGEKLIWNLRIIVKSTVFIFSCIRCEIAGRRILLACFIVDWAFFTSSSIKWAIAIKACRTFSIWTITQEIWTQLAESDIGRHSWASCTVFIALSRQQSEGRDTPFWVIQRLVSCAAVDDGGEVHGELPGICLENFQRDRIFPVFLPITLSVIVSSHDHWIWSVQDPSCYDFIIFVADLDFQGRLAIPIE